MNKIAIVTLVYREPEIFKTIRSWSLEMPDVSIFIFADGYDENTESQLRLLEESDYAEVHFSPERRGYPGAMRNALTYMYENHKDDVESILYVDSDNCYPPSEIKRMIELNDICWSVCGYRTNRKEAWYRMPYIKSENILMRVLFGFKMHDYTCAFRLMTLGAIGKVIKQSKYSKWGFWMEFDAIWHHYYGDWNEIAVEYTPQPTKIFSFKKMPKILFQEFVAIMKTWWHLSE